MGQTISTTNRVNPQSTVIVIIFVKMPGTFGVDE
jgi:hypothetical protein